MKLLIEKGRDFNLENHLEFVVQVKACEKVKKTNCLKYYKANIYIYIYIPNLLLKTQRNFAL